MPDCSVIVSTRFGVGVTDPDWFEGRFALFEAITLPSLTAQSTQNFTWLFFVGRDPLPWVVERLSVLLDRFGQRAKLTYEPMSATAINEYAKRNFDSTHCLVAFIDDDDAWHKNLLMHAETAAKRLLSKGKEKCVFTYPDGYEWLVTDIIDVDAFNKSGRVVIRKSACYPYCRPFHSMTCFTLAPTGFCFESVGSLHSSKGEIARDYGYEVQELAYPEEKAWLYARHQQADSAVHKAWANAPVQVDLENLANAFGIDAARLSAFCEKAESMPYVAKRIHKLQDKSKLMFRIDQLIKKHTDN